MKSVRSLFNGTHDVRSFSKKYFKYVSGLLDNIDIGDVAKFLDELEKARKSGNAIFFIGNGGSAATALHMVNDLSLGSRIAGNSVPFRAISLTNNVSTMTAIANDKGYQNLFLDQLRVQYRKGDRLVAISASGNSPNIFVAAEWVKKNGGMVIGFLGFNGGRLKDVCDISIHVKTPDGEYGPVEDVHVILGHLIYTWLWYEKRKKGSKRKSGGID